MHAAYARLLAAGIAAASFLGAGAAAAQTTGAPAPASAPAPAPAPAQDSTNTTTLVIPKLDHKLEAVARLGLQMPGEATVIGYYKSYTGVAPMGFLEASAIVHPFFTIGAFAQFSSADYQPQMNGSSIGDGRLNMLTTGASLKARFPVGDKLVIRAGFLVGTNLEWASVTINDTSSYGPSHNGHGYGFDIAPTVEAAYRVSRDFGLSAQFAFVAQPAGSAAFDGDTSSSDFKFAPLYTLALGAEFYR